MARLLSIHAHPDDEASKGAPTIAKYVAEGHEAVLVCATGGEQGDILNPEMDRAEVRENLPKVRVSELEKSVEIIGFNHLDWLGYQDSGMEDTESNTNPSCFARADFDEAVGKFVALIRQHRPHVIITYSDDQGYRHPDHLMVHDISVPAFERAGDVNWYPEAGEPWQPTKLYYSVWSRARLQAQQDTYQRLGLESPYSDEWFKRPSTDHRITTKIEISEHHHVRRAALLAHATQVDPDEKFWFGLPEHEEVAAYPYDDYILAQSHVTSSTPETGSLETDLLEGVEDV